MHFNSFPNDCILCIFSRLPLQNLLCIEIVCRKWQSVQRVACRQRHTVLLLVENGALDNALNSSAFTVPFDDVLVKEDGTPMFVSFNDKVNWHGLHCTGELSEPICQWLVDKLPNITSLQMSIGFQAYTMIYPILSLLTGWSSKLVTMKFWHGNTARENEYFSDIAPKIQLEISQNYWLLLGALNFLPALKNLTLDIGACFLGPDQMQRNSGQVSLPILSQLNQFYFCSYDQPDVILDSLVRYGSREPNINLRQIGVCDISITQECLDKFVKLSPELRSRFTHLLPLIIPSFSIVPHYDFEPDLDTICTKFASQTSLHFAHDSDISFSEMINALSSLKQLLVLGLFYFDEFDQFHFSDPSILNCSIAQLFSVKVLQLDFVKLSHTHLSQMNIAWVFPNLQVLQIVTSIECVECGYEYPTNINIENEKCRKCITIQIESLKKCTRLRSIKLGHSDDDINVQYEWLNIDDFIEKIVKK